MVARYMPAVRRRFMSRFFETLKEVSRSQQIPNETLRNAEPEAATVTDSDRAPVPDIPIEIPARLFADLPLPPDPPPPGAPSVDLPFPKLPDMNHEALYGGFARRQKSFSGGKTVEVKVDAKAPLLPNAVGGMAMERYRRLRTKIQQQHATAPIHSLLVASPGQGDGKTITVLNLAWSFGMLPSFKVLVVDGDLRKKTIGPVLGVGEHPGLSNLLDRSARLEDVVLRSDLLPFQFVVAGTSPKPSAELLTSVAMRESIREMTEHFDLVLVDSPPVNLMADAQTLAGSCDGVLLIARMFATATKAFERALYDMQPFRIVGTALNGGTVRERRSYSYKGYSRADG
jgi:protein-tyrosine kinase